MKNALALVIGNNNYQERDDQLTNAVNDATDMSAKLHKLGFTVKSGTDCTKLRFDELLKEFEAELPQYSVLLFFYSGHGFQVGGENFLTAIDTDFSNDIRAKHSSFSLQLVLDLMASATADVKIIILDACRNNPLKTVQKGTRINLAPVFAPKGTLIAFSTSPGERAADGGMGRNSIYTGCLLQHMDTPDIPIEVMFKRVRVSVVTATNDQTPWEHTSMVGHFSFANPGLVHTKKLAYRQDVIAYEQFVQGDAEIDRCIIDLFSTTFSDQKVAAQQVPRISILAADDSSVFLLGRALLSAAHYGSFEAKRKIERIGNWISGFERNGQNHLLNGILFEIYFDENGHLRENYFKASLMDEVYSHEGEKDFESAFAFIKEHLLPFRGRVIYLPGDLTVAIEMGLEDEEVIYSKGTFTEYKLTSLKLDTVELLHINGFRQNFSSLQDQTYKAFISQQLLVPQRKLKVISKYTGEDLTHLQVPYKFSVSR